MSGLQTCGRCGWQDRDPHVRLSLVNLAREAREDAGMHYGSDYSHELRCQDKAACRARVKAQRENQ